MLEIRCAHRLEEMEAALERAARRHNGAVLAATRLGPLAGGDRGEAVVFTLCQTDFYTALLAADPRFAAFLPCRVAARSDGNAVLLETLEPREFCRLLNRPDLEHLAAPLENVLRKIMQDASEPARVSVAAAARASSAPGATEEQINVRGTVAQRIDCHGTKIEDLAGTGKLDSPGG